MQLTKGEQEWSYLHAYDLAVSFATVLKSPTVRGIVNVGNSDTISIREVALTIGEILKKKELLSFGSLEYRQDQVMKMKPVCETLTDLGWSPRISFDSGIKQTIDWLTGKVLTPLQTKDNETLNFSLPARR
jgi:nucleoside-diphosphate-sugar epimerase